MSILDNITSTISGWSIQKAADGTKKIVGNYTQHPELVGQQASVAVQKIFRHGKNIIAQTTDGVHHMLTGHANESDLQHVEDHPPTSDNKPAA